MAAENVITPVVGLSDKDVELVEKYQESFIKKASPPPQQTKKRMRETSTPSEEVEAEVQEKSSSVMMMEILATVRGNQAHLRTIEQSLVFVHSELEAQKSETAQLRAENLEMKERIGALEAKVGTIEIDLKEESRKRDEAEQNSRMVNLEISGIPQLDGETDDDCKTIAADVMKLIGSEYGVADVDDAHRKMAGGLIVRFMSRTVRKEVLSKRFALAGKKAMDVAPRFRKCAGSKNDLYINENLSYDRSKLMKICRDRIKPLNVGATTKEQRTKTKSTRGHVQVQKPDGNFAKIKNVTDFERVYPDL